MQEATRALDEATLLAQMGWVRDLARHLVSDPGLAEDVAQDAWLAAHTAPPAEVRSEGQLRAWLSVVVRNLVRRDSRSAGRRGDREATAARAEALESTADVVARAGLAQDLTREVMQLDDPYRSAILLRYFDGLSTAAVGERQGIGPAAARKRLSRGLEQLRARLDAGHDGDRDAWTMALLPLIRVEPAATVAAGSTVGSLTGALVLNAKLVTALLVVALAFLAVLDPFDGAAPLDRGSVDPSPGTAGAEVTLEQPEPGQGTPDRSALAVTGLRLEVVDRAGLPLAGAWVGLLEDGALASRGTTDERGLLALPGPVPDGELLVVAEDRVPVRAPLPPDVGPTAGRVVLGEGATLAGVLQGVDEPGRLALPLEFDRTIRALEGLAPDVLAELAQLHVAPDRVLLTPAADGGFRCAGLPTDWTGALLAPAGHRLGPDAAPGHLHEDLELLLLRPRTDLVVPLEPQLSLRGSLVASDTGQPVPGLWLEAHRATRLVGRALTDAAGAFELTLDDADANDAELVLSLAGTPARGGPWTFAAVPEDGLLGELAVDLGRRLTYLVATTDGEPVPGAVGHVVAEDLHGTPSDTSGRGDLWGVRATGPELIVTRPGFATARVPAAAEGPTRVTLRPASSLLVEVRDQDGRVPDDVRLQVVGDEDLWAAPWGTGWLELEPGTAPAAARAGRALLEGPRGLDADGRLELGPLLPGVRLEVRLLSTSGDLLESRPVVTPAPGAPPLEVAFERPRAGFLVEGIARDAEGRPLPRVRIHAETHSGTHGVRSDGDGRFALGPFEGRARLTYLEAARPGFAAAQLRDLDLEPGSPPLELTLWPARRLTVALVDDLGRTPAVPFLEAELSDGSLHAGLPTGDGGYAFRALPMLDGEVRVELAGVTSRVPIDGLQTSARLELPALGALAVELAPTAELLAGARVCVVWERLEDGEALAEERRYFRTAGDGLEPLALDLPPGSYRVRLEQRVLARRLVEALGEARTVELRPGETTSVQLP